MSEIETSPFRFDYFNITESFIKVETKRLKGSIDFKFSISPSGEIDEKEKKYTLFMTVKIDGENKEKENVFECKVKIAGTFSFKNVNKKELLSNYFYTNAPAIIFPYIRSYIASLTALSGFETINLPPVNIASLREELKENTTTVN